MYEAQASVHSFKELASNLPNQAVPWRFWQSSWNILKRVSLYAAGTVSIVTKEENFTCLFLAV